MTDFHDLQLKEQLLLQQKWEDGVDVDEGNVCDLCVCSVKPNKFFDKTLLLPTEMNLDNAFVGLLPPFFQPCFCMKKKDSFGCRSVPSDKKCKKTSVGG